MPILRTNKLVKFLALFCGSGALLLILFPLVTTAAFTKQINYQGKLTNASGAAVAGNYDMEFKLYASSTGGTALWTETRTGANQVPVTSGLFSVMLGSVSSLDAIDFNQPLYLSIKINTDAEMTPRKVLGAVSNAFNSEKFDGLSTSSVAVLNRANTYTATNTFSTVDMIDGNTYKYNGVNIAYGSTTLRNFFYGGAGNLTMSGSFNLANGYQALASTTSGNNNLAYGTRALFLNTGGYQNIALGSNASYSNVDGSNNVAIGSSALHDNVSGFGNSALGYEALSYNSSSTGNTAFGFQAGAGTTTTLTTNQFNSLFGYQSGFNLTTGNNNSAFGYQSGFNLTSGSNNILIGAGVDAPASTTNSFLNIGNALYGDLSNGNIGIGTTNLNARLKIDNTSNPAAYSLYSVGGPNYLAGTTTFGVGTNILAITPMSINGGNSLGMEISGVSHISNVEYPVFSIKNQVSIRGADGDPNITFGDSNLLNLSQITAYPASTGYMEFTGANRYVFDNDIEVQSGSGIWLGGVYRDTWPSGVGGTGGSFWATSSDSLVGYPDLAGQYAIVIGAAATTSDDKDTSMRLKVAGNTKLAGNLTVTGYSSTTGNYYVWGNIGVGTSTPGGKLVVANGSIKSLNGYSDGYNISSSSFKTTSLLSVNSINFGEAEVGVHGYARTYNAGEITGVGVYGEAVGDLGIGGLFSSIGAGSQGLEVYVNGTNSTGVLVRTEGPNTRGLQVETSDGEYGLYINNASTSQYSIYSVGGRNYFGNGAIINGNATATSLSLTTLANQFLSVNGLGQVVGTSTPVIAELDPYYAVASSTLLRYGTSTDALTEGSKLFYLDSRVGNYIIASTTPLSSLLNYWTKTGSNLSYSAGKIGVGTSTPSAFLDIVGTYTDLSSVSYGQRSTYNFNPSVSSGVNQYGSYLETIATSSSGVNLTGDVVGSASYARHFGAGTASSLYGFVSGITNATGAGAVTNAYGLYLASTTGAITNNYGIYQLGAGATNYFAGKIGLGTTSPQSILDIWSSSNGQVASILSNVSTGSSAFAELSVRNGPTTDSALRMMAMGTGNILTGAFASNTGVINADINLSGLNLLARAKEGVMSFFTGGYTDFNKRLSILSNGEIGIGTTSPAGRFSVDKSYYKTIDGSSWIATNSTTITGVGTKFLSQIKVGENIELFITTYGGGPFPNFWQPIKVASVESDTSFTSATPILATFAGTSMRIVDSKPVFIASGGSNSPYLTVGYSGLVGIGTDNPNALLNIKGDGTDYFRISSSTNPNIMVVNSRGQFFFNASSEIFTNANSTSHVTLNALDGVKGSFMTINQVATTTSGGSTGGITIAQGNTDYWNISKRTSHGTTRSPLVNLESDTLNITYGTDPSGAPQNTPAMTFATSGFVGVGTTTPRFALVVGAGGATTSSVQIPKGALCIDDDGFCNPAVAGRIYALSNAITAHSDLAENYSVAEEGLSAGDIVAASESNIDASSKEKFGIRKAKNSNELMGVISTDPGIILDSPEDGIENSRRLPVALSGRVPLKVNLEGGTINVGDLITLSSVAGVGTKATSSTQTLGLALEPFNSGSSKDANGVGKIMVFVNLSYYHIDSSVSQGQINVNGLWSVDDLGQIKTSSSLNLANLDIVNVRSVLSASGNWSISEDGTIVVKRIQAETMCLGQTCFNEDQLKALLLKNGLSSVTPPPASGSSTEQPVVEASSTPPEATSSEPVAEPAIPAVESPEPVVVPEEPVLPAETPPSP